MLSIVAIPLGILLGIFLTWLSCDKVLSIFKLDLHVNEVFSIKNTIAVFVICLVSVLIASIVPAFKAKSLSPMVACRNNTDTLKKYKKSFFSDIINKFLGFKFMMAYRNIFRHKTKNIITLNSIIITNVLVMLLICFFSNLGIENVIKRFEFSDYSLYTDMAKSDKFTQDDINEIKSIEGVNNIFGMNVTDDTNTYIHIDKSMFSIGNITSDEKESFDKLFVESSSKAFNTNIYGYDPYLIQRCENQFESTNITSNNELNALIYMNNASIRIKEGTVIGLDIGKGDIIPISCTLVTEGQPKTITLNAKVYGFLSGLPVSIGYYPAESPLVVVDRKELNKHLGLGETYSHIYINTDKSNRESVENSLRKLSQDKAWKFVSNHEERDKALKELWTMILAALAFIFIVFLIGMLNIYNTVNTNIILKLNEIGIIKAIGTSQKEILQIQTFEGAILGIIGSVISLIISTSVCFALSTMERTENIFSGIPWPVFIGIAILNIIICISVVYLCARKINKLNIMQSINYIN